MTFEITVLLYITIGVLVFLSESSLVFLILNRLQGEEKSESL